MRVLIIGAGGHGEVVADALLASARAGGDLQVVGFLDDDAALEGAVRLGLPVFGPVERVATVPHEALIVAIGSNAVRRERMEALICEGEVLAPVVHPSAVVGAEAQVGGGTVICAAAVVGVGACVGRGAILNTSSSVDHHCQIGDYCHVAPGAHAGGGVTLGEGVFVGIGASILPGVRVGEWSTVGAGAVVIEDVGPHEVVIGVPARPIQRKD